MGLKQACGLCEVGPSWQLKQAGVCAGCPRPCSSSCPLRREPLHELPEAQKEASLGSLHPLPRVRWREESASLAQTCEDGPDHGGMLLDRSGAVTACLRTGSSVRAPEDLS